MKPDWDVAVIDGQPEVVVNAAAVARMALASPLGIHRAMANLKAGMSPEVFAKVEAELFEIAYGTTTKPNPFRKEQS